MNDKDTKQKLLRFPVVLLDRLEKVQDAGQSMNALIVECVEDSLNRHENNTLTDIIQDGAAGPTQTRPAETSPDNMQQDAAGPDANIERGLVTMPPDIIRAAQNTVKMYDDIPAQIRAWTELGRNTSKAMNTAAMESIQSSKPQLPAAPLDNTPPLKQETSQAAPAATAQDDIIHDALLDAKPKQSIREKITSHMETVSNIGKRLNKINLNKHA